MDNKDLLKYLVTAHKNDEILYQKVKIKNDNIKSGNTRRKSNAR